MSAILAAAALLATPASQRPLMRDFIGLNGHTFQIDAKKYAPAFRQFRDYHPVAWDMGDTLEGPATFPISRNKVDWLNVYSSWRQAGIGTNASLQFESIKPDLWDKKEDQAREYGESFATYFGPSTRNLVQSAEIGNEPADFTVDQYRRMYKSMAEGLRKGDPKLMIGPCAVAVGDADKYSKNISVLDDLVPYVDFLNVHVYAFLEGWPTWKRTYPENPKTPFGSQVKGVLDWRDKHAPGRPVWVTEYGWDSSTKPAPTTGDFSKFQGNTDLEQAQFLVRGALFLVDLGADRAYVYYYDDKDEPTLHAGSGVMRNGQPKPSFYAMRQLQRNLGEYRLARTFLKESEGVWVQEYAPSKAGADTVWVVWNATTGGHTKVADLDLGAYRVTQAESMATKDGDPPAADVKSANRRLTLTATESPTYVWLRK